MNSFTLLAVNIRRFRCAKRKNTADVSKAFVAFSEINSSIQSVRAVRDHLVARMNKMKAGCNTFPKLVSCSSADAHRALRFSFATYVAVSETFNEIDRIEVELGQLNKEGHKRAICLSRARKRVEHIDDLITKSERKIILMKDAVELSDIEEAIGARR